MHEATDSVESSHCTSNNSTECTAERTRINEHSTAASEDSSSSSLPVKKKKRVYKKRRSTHSIRKEQKATLQKEIEELQVTLDAIKSQALAQQEEVSYQDRVARNAILRETIQEQHLAMAQVRALLSQQKLCMRPMGARICLGVDRNERRRLLHALRGPKLREAKRILNARSRGLSPTSPYFQEETYKTEEGDFYATRFEISRLYGVKGGVRAVYDAVLQSAFNAEIIISETSGNITIREDDDQDDNSVAQMRLVSQTAGGVLLETNLVQFAEFLEIGNAGNGNEGDYAIAATDFIDEDGLYPYRPQERIRRDVTAAMMVTSYRKASDQAASRRVATEGLQEGENELVVVVTRLFCTKVYQSDVDISSYEQLQLQESSARSSGNVVNFLRNILGLPSGC